MEGADIYPTAILIVGPLLTLVAIIFSIADVRKKRLLQDTPTSKVQGVFIGLVELKGNAEAENPLTSFLAGLRCVHFAWTAEERWTRTVTVTETDKDGHTRTRTRTETGWETVASGGKTMPFYLKDDTGVILVHPEGADIEPASVFDRTCGPTDPLYYGKGPAGAVNGSDSIRRFTEDAIPLHAPLFVVGRARERRDVVAPEIARDPAAPMFIISTRTEEAVTAGFAHWAWGLGLLGLALSAGTVAARHMARKEPIADEAEAYVLSGLGYLAAWSLGWVWMLYNSLVGLRERVREGWSLIDVELKRRHDLITNLVEVTRALRDYERTVQTHVAELRGQLAATPPGEPGPDPSGCVPVIRAVVERYPELKADEGFLRLQKSLVETEQRIALARGYFNEVASFYNARLEKAPDRFLTGLGGFQPRALLAAANFERAQVAVKLSD